MICGVTCSASRLWTPGCPNLAHTMSDPVRHKNCKCSQCHGMRGHTCLLYSPEVLWYHVCSPSTHMPFQTIQLSRPWPSPRASPSVLLYPSSLQWLSVNLPDFAHTVTHLPLQVAGFNKTRHQFIRSEVGTCFLSLVLSDRLQPTGSVMNARW